MADLSGVGIENLVLSCQVCYQSSFSVKTSSNIYGKQVLIPSRSVSEKLKNLELVIYFISKVIQK